MKTNSEILNLIRQLESLSTGEPWYGESLLQKLEQIGPEEAFAVPLPGIHAIAQVVSHIIVWRRVLVEKIKGNLDFRIGINSAEDWPPVSVLREKGWEQILTELAESQQEITAALSSRTDSFLDEVYSESYTYRFLIEAILQHDVYHIGQIGLLSSVIKATK